MVLSAGPLRRTGGSGPGSAALRGRAGPAVSGGRPADFAGLAVLRRPGLLPGRGNGVVPGAEPGLTPGDRPGADLGGAEPPALRKRRGPGATELSGGLRRLLAGAAAHGGL